MTTTLGQPWLKNTFCFINLFNVQKPVFFYNITEVLSFRFYKILMRYIKYFLKTLSSFYYLTFKIQSFSRFYLKVTNFNFFLLNFQIQQLQVKLTRFFVQNSRFCSHPGGIVVYFGTTFIFYEYWYCIKLVIHFKERWYCPILRNPRLFV